jgi:hypothetical protein
MNHCQQMFNLKIVKNKFKNLIFSKKKEFFICFFFKINFYFFEYAYLNQFIFHDKSH